MKHNLQVTLILIFLFLAAQYIGIAIIRNSETLPFDVNRPVFSEEYGSLQLFGYILVASAIAFLISFLSLAVLWRIIFFLSVLFCLTIAFGAFMSDLPAFALALLLTLGKTFRIHQLIHNFTELFIYGGLAAVFVPSLNLMSISILLILISIYDGIAVWKTKHMIAMAKFQTKAKMFSGLLIPYQKRVAMLGGGDIGFPLIFSGVAYNALGIKALTIPAVVALSLFILLMQGEKNKFYPAMPFLTVGCFIGYFLTLVF